MRDNPGLSSQAAEDEARKLIRIDRQESDDKNDPGQKITSIFHRADVFIRCDTEKNIRETTTRFVNAFFGDTSISPTKDEFGAFLAKVAALRSVDLSRQVGAALMTDCGEVISVGCNEVPKAGGGNYWTDDIMPQRDIDIEYEGNKTEIAQIAHNFIDLLKQGGVIDSSLPSNQILTTHPELLSKSMVGDITEYGRMTHAEMSAICDAARLGRPLKDAFLYVTTFPCHNCSKHIVASGIRRVVYIEPYEKSRAAKLHGDSIETGGRSVEKVVFEPFAGISPSRYREIFDPHSPSKSLILLSGSQYFRYKSWC